MEKDETLPEVEQEQKNNEGEEILDIVEEDEPKEKEDYQGKLNATNRFLKKEGYEFKGGKWVKNKSNDKPIEKPEVVNTDGLSTKDIIALSKVDEEDIDEVSRVAKILGKTVSEALKDSTLNTILNVRKEERKTAKATQTKGGAPASKVSGESLLKKAQQGELPETDEGIEKLVEHEMALKTKK